MLLRAPSRRMEAASCFETLTSPCGQGELLSMRPIELLRPYSHLCRTARRRYFAGSNSSAACCTIGFGVA